MRFHGALFLAAVPSLLIGCTTFATVRSAEPYPGTSVSLQASASTPPGDLASWFWSFDCAEACNHSIVGGDLGVTYGWQLGGGPRAMTIGAGINGLSPYVDGYMQLAAGPRPFGLGARLGLPALSWNEHEIYARYDIPIAKESRLLLNPGVFLHQGRSPNGASSGSFLGFVQGVGLQIEGEYVSWTPAVAVVAGQSRRDRYGNRDGPVSSVFATASMGVTLHRRRVKPDH